MEAILAIPPVLLITPLLALSLWSYITFTDNFVSRDPLYVPFFFFLGPQIALTCALLFWVCPVIKSFFFFSSKGGMIENIGNLLANEQVVRLILCRLFNWAKGNVVVVLVVEYEAESILCVYWAQKRLRFPLPFLFYKPL